MSGNRHKHSCFILGEVERICRCGVLGRSPVYPRLLRYLSDTTLAGSVPREIDIAVDVFGKQDFDSTTDSSVRVYLHNLRQKIDGYYAEQGGGKSPVIRIPRGEYRLQVDHGDTAAEASRRIVPLRSPMTKRAAVLAALFAAVGFGWIASEAFAPQNEYRELGNTALWRPLSRGKGPLVVVLGDYYIFGEVGRAGAVDRLIRDFDINSRGDLETRYGDSAAVTADAVYTDIRLSYLPTGIGAALADVLAVVRSAGRDVVVIPGSELDVKTVQSSDIVYIGYLSGLHLLERFVFSASRVEPGPTFDELVSRDGGKVYVSEAGIPDGAASDYVDYGFLSTFAGPNGNHLLVLAGMRDEALMQMAASMASTDTVAALLAVVPDTEAPLSMEALYRVRGMNRMHIASTLVFASELNAANIWIEREKIAHEAGLRRDAQ